MYQRSASYGYETGMAVFPKRAMLVSDLIQISSNLVPRILKGVSNL
jgi:hypothetical protein